MQISYLIDLSDGSAASRVYIPANTLNEGIVVVLKVTLKVPRRVAGETQKMFQLDLKPTNGHCYASPSEGKNKQHI